MTDVDVKRLSPRLIAALAGVALLLAGGILGLTVALSGPDPSSPVAAAQPGHTDASAADQPALSTPPPTLAGASQPAPLTGDVAATQEPFWRQKQREAEAEMAGRQATSTTLAASQQKSASSELPSLAGLPTLPSGDGFVTAASGTRLVLSGGRTPLRGVWAGRPEELSRFLLASNPTPRFTVSALTLARLYVTYAGQVGLRADALWSQMLHETGFGKYGGDVSASQNNFAGIGATGGGAAGHGFPTAEAGVKAHIAHMVAYVYASDVASWTNASTDPRYDAVSPRGVARMLADLDGRWAVPGIGYGQAIERLVAQINR